MLQRIGIYLLYLLSLTWRIRSLGTIDNYPKVIAFWHGNMLPVWFYFRKFNKKVAIISKSKDGQILSDYLELLNYQLIRGSSSKGGKEVIQNATKLVKENILLITPDGPRGPIGKMKVGAVIISHNGKVPIQFCSVNCKWKLKLKSWDKFIIPMPFTKITLEFSEILEIDNIENHDEVNREIEEFEKLMGDVN